MGFCFVGVLLILGLLVLCCCVALALSPPPAHSAETVRSQARQIKLDTLRQMRHIANELNEDIVNQTHQHKP